MPATLMQLRRLTRERMGVPTADDFFTDPVIDDHINLAVQALEGEYRWPWADMVTQETLTPAAPDITLADNWRATRAVLDDGQELYLVAPADIMSSESASGVPRVWCPVGGVLLVRPKVTETYTLTHYWYRQSAWLRLDNDAPDIPAQFAGAVVAKAAALLSSREGDRSASTAHGEEYAAWITRMRRDVRRSTPPTRVRVRPGSWI